MTSFQKFIVTAYRYLAGIVLLSILASAIGYGFVTAFYAVNSSWVAPVIISQTNEKILQIKAEVVRTNQNLAATLASISGITAETKLLEEEELALTHLVGKSDFSKRSQISKDSAYESSLNRLHGIKLTDITHLKKLVKELEVQSSSVDADLAAGLITRDEAARSLLAIQNARSAATDADLAATAISRQALDLRHSAQTLGGAETNSMQATEFLFRAAQTKSQIASIRVKIMENKKEIEIKKQSAEKIQKLLLNISASPYFIASNADVSQTFAFFPYDNQDAVKAGSAVYDCILQVIICTKVGVVKELFHDEERAQHPLFRSDMRGSLLSIEFTDKSAAKSRVLFVNSPPLFF